MLIVMYIVLFYSKNINNVINKIVINMCNFKIINK